jgi:hypothetical protein
MESGFEMDGQGNSELEKMALQELVRELTTQKDTFNELSKRLHEKLFELESHKSILAEELTREVLKKM